MPLPPKLLLTSILAPATLLTLYTSSLRLQSTSPNSNRNSAVTATRTLHTLNDSFVCSMRNIREGRAYTLLTAGLQHGSIMHLAFNGVTFWSLGEMMCLLPGIGPAAMLGTFAGGILVGNVGSLWAEREGRGKGREGRELGRVGMSGGVMAMTAAVGVVVPRLPFSFMFIPVPIPAWAFVPIFGGLSVLANRGDYLSGIDHVGHLGGLGLGLLAGLILRRRIPMKRPYGR